MDAHEARRWLPGNRSRKPTDRTMMFYRDLRRPVTVPEEGGMMALPDALHGLTFMRLVRGTDWGTTTTVIVTMKS